MSRDSCFCHIRLCIVFHNNCLLSFLASPTVPMVNCPINVNFFDGTSLPATWGNKVLLKKFTFTSMWQLTVGTVGHASLSPPSRRSVLGSNPGTIVGQCSTNWFADRSGNDLDGKRTGESGLRGCDSFSLSLSLFNAPNLQSLRLFSTLYLLENFTRGCCIDEVQPREILKGKEEKAYKTSHPTRKDNSLHLVFHFWIWDFISFVFCFLVNAGWILSKF